LNPPRHLLLPAVLAAALLLAALPAAADSGRVSKVYRLGVADPHAAREVAEGLVSREGKVVLDEGHHTLIVLDAPERQAAVAEALQSLQGPLASIRVRARIVDHETGEEAGVSASGQLLLTLPGPGVRSDVVFDVKSKGVGKSRSSKQSVVVVSGGEASIAVGREIPYQQWFLLYGKEHGVVAAEVKWKDVGSRLAVSPTVIDGGRRVRLRVVPVISYGKGKKREDVPYAGVATELVLEDGEELRIGGSEEDEEFYGRFFSGYDRQRRVRRVDIFVRVKILAGETGGVVK
jgi:type II secretory pathway component GspD/PulD (secretin)